MKYTCLAIAVLAVSTPSSAVSQDTLDAIATASIEEQVPFKLLKALCMSESSLNPKAINKQDGGSASYGLCQLKINTVHIRGIFMHHTAHGDHYSEHMGATGSVWYTKRDLMNPWINSRLAARYLKHQLNRYNGDVRKAISAYKSGHYTPNNKKYVDRVINN